MVNTYRRRFHSRRSEKAVPSERQRAVNPVGVTATASRMPQDGQKRGGSSSRLHPGHLSSERPHPEQKLARSAISTTGHEPCGSDEEGASLGHSAADNAPIGMERSSSIRRSSWGERPSVVR
jgi:hypothetical protein